MRLSIVGAGSTYTPELIDGVIRRREHLPITSIVLYDIDLNRLKVIGDFARRMIDASGGGIEIHQTNSQDEAVQDARFVVSQFRIGNQAARHRDELIGRKFNLVGQETVGVGGFAKGIRTIPVAIALADSILKYSPNATLLNFTNPAGMITEALLRERPALQTIGLCNVPWNVKTEIANTLSVPFQELELDYVGLNHLSWVRGLKVAGQDLSREAILGFQGLVGKQNPDDEEPYWSQESISQLGAIPNYYLLYYYETQKWLRFQMNAPTRASVVMEIEKSLLLRYQDKELTNKPEELMKRGGAYYSDSAAQLMTDIATDSGAIHIVNTRNMGAVPGMDVQQVMEMPCMVNSTGAHPIPVQAMRPDIEALVKTVKDFELLTIEAAVEGDETAAIRALVTNPLGPDLSQAKEVWQTIKEEHRGLLGKLDD